MGKTTTFNDIFKKGFLDINMASTLSTFDIFFILVMTFLIGLFIFIVYKRTYQGVLYTPSFNISLIVLSMVTAMIIVAVRSNIILSLGMVGALSIVRFRTAIKDPMDIVFMFWAIAVGIANGALFFKISIVGSIMIALTIFLLTRLQSGQMPYLLIVNHVPDQNNNVINQINKLAPCTIRSKVSDQNNVELTLELRVKGNDTEFVDKISKIEGVANTVLVSYNGDKLV